MLFIGSTMNKETQLSSKEKGRQKIGQLLRILLVESHGHHRINSLFKKRKGEKKVRA